MQEDVEAQRSLLSQSSRDDREAGEEDDRVEGGFDEEGSSPSTREKGKEKEKDGVRPPPRGRHVSILFSNESGGNLELWVEPGDSVGSVKEQVSGVLESCCRLYGLACFSQSDSDLTGLTEAIPRSGPEDLKYESRGRVQGTDPRYATSAPPFSPSTSDSSTPAAS